MKSNKLSLMISLSMFITFTSQIFVLCIFLYSWNQILGNTSSELNIIDFINTFFLFFRIYVFFLLILITLFLFVFSERSFIETRTHMKNTIIKMEIDKKVKSEERYELSMDITNVGIYDWNLETNEIFYSPAWKKLLGYERSELSDSLSSLEKLTHPDDAKRAFNMLKEHINKERDNIEIELRMKHKKGHWVDILSRAKAVFNEDGRAIRVLGTHIDISRRKKNERELTLKNAALENSLNGFIIINHERRLIYINRAFAQFYEYPDKQEMIGMDPIFLFDIPETISVIIHHIREKREYISEQRAKKRDGSLFDLLIYARLAFDYEGNEIYTASCIDVTEQNRVKKEKKTLEKELIQAHKMESIGTLAGGIAHDFNNILASIIGFSELSMKMPDLNPALKDNLKEIYSSGLRAKELTKQILTFARASNEELEPVQPMLIIQEIIKFLRSSIPANIQIDKNISSTSFIMCNPTQIYQILLNLCTNATDAMADMGGILSISLEDFEQGDNVSQTLKLALGEYVVIKVSDTGTGIEPDMIKKIFQPYFTTKAIGKGTGMGLSLVRGIVENLAGKITIKSRLGRGTTFSIYLPKTQNEYDHEINLFEELPMGHERILFVDDEISITKLAQHSLSDLGYGVTTLNNSQEALALFTERPHDFDLVITDMTMPGLTGDRLASELKKIRPDIPIILCSGYSNEMTKAKSLGIDIKAFLNKPLTKKELALMIRKILENPDSWSPYLL